MTLGPVAAFKLYIDRILALDALKMWPSAASGFPPYDYWLPALGDDALLNDDPIFGVRVHLLRAHDPHAREATLRPTDFSRYVSGGLIVDVEPRPAHRQAGGEVLARRHRLPVRLLPQRSRWGDRGRGGSPLMGPIAELKTEFERFLALTALGGLDARLYHPEWQALLARTLPCQVWINAPRRPGFPWGQGVYWARRHPSLSAGQRLASIAVRPETGKMPRLWFLIHLADFCRAVLSGEVTDL